MNRLKTTVFVRVYKSAPKLALFNKKNFNLSMDKKAIALLLWKLYI